jgi:predicted MFS family arabinose efflux permease
MVVAAPLGAYLGSIVGWRGAFFCLAPVALIALAWQWISLPSMPAEQRRGSKAFAAFALLRSPLVLLGMLAVGIFFMGQFTLFTYVRPFLETVTRVDVGTLSLILLVMGIAGFIGTVFIGAALRRGFYPTLIAIPLLMAVVGIALMLFGTWMAAAVTLLGLWGLVGTAAPVGWWAWVPKAFPRDAEAGGGLMVAVIQLAIALGSTVGGLLFDMGGYRSGFAASVVLLLIAGLLAFMTSTKGEPR